MIAPEFDCRFLFWKLLYNNDSLYQKERYVTCLFSLFWGEGNFCLKERSSGYFWRIFKNTAKESDVLLSYLISINVDLLIFKPQDEIMKQAFSFFYKFF